MGGRPPPLPPPPPPPTAMPKTKLFLQSSKIFQMLGVPPLHHQWSPADGGGALCPPNIAFPPVQISDYAPDTRRELLVLPKF